MSEFDDSLPEIMSAAPDTRERLDAALIDIESVPQCETECRRSVDLAWGGERDADFTLHMSTQAQAGAKSHSLSFGARYWGLGNVVTVGEQANPLYDVRLREARNLLHAAAEQQTYMPRTQWLRKVVDLLPLSGSSLSQSICDLLDSSPYPVIEEEKHNVDILDGPDGLELSYQRLAGNEAFKLRYDGTMLAAHTRVALTQPDTDGSKSYIYDKTVYPRLFEDDYRQRTYQELPRPHMEFESEESWFGSLRTNEPVAPMGWELTEAKVQRFAAALEAAAVALRNADS